MLDAFIKHLAKEASSISQAPVTFVVAFSIIAIAAYAVAKWYFHGTLVTLEASIKLRDDQIADFKDKTNTNTPEEAQQRLATLESEIASLRPRRISEEQARKMRSRLASISPHAIEIASDAQSRDARGYSRQIGQLFERAGWHVSLPTVMGIGNAPECGMRLHIRPTAELNTLATALTQMFADAEIRVDVVRSAISPNGAAVHLLVTDVI